MSSIEPCLLLPGLRIMKTAIFTTIIIIIIITIIINNLNC